MSEQGAPLDRICLNMRCTIHNVEYGTAYVPKEKREENGWPEHFVPDCPICSHKEMAALRSRLFEVERRLKTVLAAIDVKLTHIPLEGA